MILHGDGLLRIAVIGTGYVGLVSGACFSEFGFSVTCVDNDQAKIDLIQNGTMPIYEPGLEDLVARNVAASRLHFTTDLGTAVADADAVFIAVGTPTRRGDGHADLSFVYAVAREIAPHLDGYTVVVTKSTVPVGTGREVYDIVAQTNPQADFDVASNPEFLREGAAISDFMRPDRVVVGTMSERARTVIRALYRPLYLIETPIIFTELETSELIKYASNAFLAVKISYINQMADLCEAVGANVHDVAKGMGLDKRIGNKFLHPGPGYGGSCFPKDTLALVKTAEQYNIDIGIVDEVVSYNDKRKNAMAGRVKAALDGVVAGKVIAVLGLAFKPETDDMRDSPSVDIIRELVDAGAQIKTYDPKAMDEARHMLPDSVSYCASAGACINDADAVVIVTEWNEFRALTAAQFIAAMRGHVLVDLRNIYDGAQMRDAGLSYSSIGR
ncbi:Predicted UDP-glucose 6-dehydrogenase [Candidatus Puniceispirillum marinum IMCC1322]|uniref:UDP-glucose 6-dehydrogenase n=1 Tax=Puniceispirillum marinum (strain IMCC1322) TaxID=488538 RepID=D5BUG9_PUNMI|nr:Predicted UDP-glucose 6-dehydrogenase [Candidatus Puniceispirillum marinum IMCC1322]